MGKRSLYFARGVVGKMEKVITREELYKKEIREMQREINYLRKRVVQLNDELDEFKQHTTSAITYLNDQASDI